MANTTVCAPPIAWGPNKGKPATGTNTGYTRHQAAGEPACGECLKARREASRRSYAKNPEMHVEASRRWQKANYRRYSTRKREWEAENPEKKRAYDSAYRKRHRAQIREQRLKAYYEDPEKFRARTREWYANNTRVHAETARKWREANPERSRLIARQAQNRRRARLADALTVDFTTSDLELRMSMFGFACWMCGGPFEDIDHVKPLAAGGAHILANLRPSCHSCNASKGANWPLE